MKNIAERIYKIGSKFLIPLEPLETYKLVVEEAMKLIDADYGSILLEIDGELTRVYASSPHVYKIKPRRRGIMYNVFKTHQAVILSSNDIEKVHPEFISVPTQSDIAIPLSYRNKTLGVLTMMSRKSQAFTKQELRVLKLFSPLATLAIRKTQLYDETKQALDIRDKFIALASHELRTPLTTINGYAQLLKSKTKGQLNPEAKWIEELSWECKRLSGLVKELLEINLIKSGHLQFIWKQCHLTEIINRSITNFRFNHPKQDIIFNNFTGDETDTVIADFDKLIQAIDNLTNNSVKFSRPNTPIKIDLLLKKNTAIIKVIDKGQGISAKDLNRVHEEFFKVADNFKEGIGLGLFLTKHIISQHHGSLKIKSNLNKGTIVEIRLPRIIQ